MAEGKFIEEIVKYSFLLVFYNLVIGIENAL